MQYYDDRETNKYCIGYFKCYKLQKLIIKMTELNSSLGNNQ